MGNKKGILSCLLLMPILVATPGCSGSDTAKLANEMSFPLDGVNEIKISYDEENITYYQGSGNRLIVMEYMSEDKRSYHAKVDHGGGVIHISEGGKPLMRGGFKRYVEVYLPVGYRETLITSTTSGGIDLTGVDVGVSAFHGDTTSGRIIVGAVTADNVKLTTTSGEITCGKLAGAVDLETKSGVISVQEVDAGDGLFQAYTTSGAFRLGLVEAGQVKIKTTSGSVTCDEMSGNITYTTTSGDLSIESASGSGGFDAANQGEIAVAFALVNGDVSMTNKNGKIHLTLPADLSFHFQGTTRNGNIDTAFGSALNEDGDSLYGDVGDAPAVTVKVETREGDIAVTRFSSPMPAEVSLP